MTLEDGWWVIEMSEEESKLRLHVCMYGEGYSWQADYIDDEPSTVYFVGDGDSDRIFLKFYEDYVRDSKSTQTQNVRSRRC